MGRKPMDTKKTSGIMLRKIGLNSLDEVERRLNNCYLLHLMKEKSIFGLRKKFLHDYCVTMSVLLKGMKLSKVARTRRIKEGTIKSWLIGQTPHLVRLASLIPSENPRLNYNWLPLFIEKGWKYSNFIQVPVKIEDYSDILKVLKQLEELKSDKMKEWESIFGYTDKEFALGYILGMMISDSDKDRATETISTRLRLGLSKKYESNLNIGEAFCYCLGKLGIMAKRVKDGKPFSKAPNGKFIWRSQYSPFISWLKECCLGLISKETTTYTPIKAEWISNGSENFRIGVLNGIYDGDGCSYIRGWQITNASRPNQVFLQNLLKTFDIKSRIRGPKVIIETKDDLRKASELCLFKFCLDRLYKTKKLIKMLENSQHVHSHKDYKKITERILDLNKIGYKPRDVPQKIFDEFGIGIHPRRIYTVLRRANISNEKTN